jgi:hypothetical protein
MNQKVSSTKSTAVEKAKITALAIGTGLGMCGVTEAAVVYNNNINFNHFKSVGSWPYKELDINNDGVNDFQFSHSYQASYGYGSGGYDYPPYSPTYAFSSMSALGFNGVVAGQMATGALIGPGVSMEDEQELGYIIGTFDGNPWSGTGILGFIFKIDGENHYGWAELSISNTNASIKISKLAYEDVANTKIFAGQLIPIPATAPLLGAALGALGVGAFRRRKREYKSQQKAKQTD